MYSNTGEHTSVLPLHHPSQQQMLWNYVTADHDLPYLVDPDQHAGKGHSNALHKVADHMQHRSSQVHVGVVMTMVMTVPCKTKTL